VPESEAPLRVLVFSTLYPSSVRPGHGVFVETRLRELLGSGQVQARVVAPVPWFPSTDPRHGARALMAATPRAETRNGINVQHPRYALLPKVGQSMHPFVLALGALPTLRRLQRQGFDFDLIDAHFYYPDGVAAALLARWLGKPLVITARGSDLNVFGRDAVPRRLMRWAGGVAGASIGVCHALVDVLQGWGLPPGRLHVVRNGVDTQRFSPQPQGVARAALGIDGAPLLLSVGHLVPVKGHDIALQALARLLPSHPGARLVFVGDGPLRTALQAQAKALGITTHVHFAGAVPNDRLADWYSAADALVLASRSEGWANVLLEAMACGTPVVATAVGGTAEVVAQPDMGRLVPPRDPAALAEGIGALLRSPPDRAAVRAYAERFSWQETTDAQLRLFREVLAQHRSAGRRQPLETA
jgi:teichuronic acid biosynthesis glycosyltransferase TuaC